MSRVLLTAFEPFGEWKSNSSWQLVIELTKDLPSTPEIVTRLYPVDFEQLPIKLEEDLAGGFDYAIHLGQNAKACGLELERIAINAGQDPADPARGEFLLADDGPAAYRSQLPIERWAEGIRRLGTPTSISYDAGQYCCNGIYYLSQHIAKKNGLPTESLFVHVPVTPQQAAESGNGANPSLETARGAAGMRYLLDQLVKRGPKTRAVS